MQAVAQGEDQVQLGWGTQARLGSKINWADPNSLMETEKAENLRSAGSNKQIFENTGFESLGVE